MTDEERLREFARDVLSMTDTLDGADVESVAWKYGLYEIYTATEPCAREECWCLEEGFPAQCRRLSPVLTGTQISTAPPGPKPDQTPTPEVPTDANTTT